MATREQVALMRAARSGTPSAELALGRCYLFGAEELKKNLMSSLYWLHRAASHDQASAWMLIGAHIPYATVAATPEPMHFCTWYERAMDAGVPQAAVVLARLLLDSQGGDGPPPAEALAALEKAASGGILEAQWLLARELKRTSDYLSSMESNTRASDARLQEGEQKRAVNMALGWAARAAQSGVREAQKALANRAWRMGDHEEFLRWSLPAACAMIDVRGRQARHGTASEEEMVLAYRCGKSLMETGQAHAPKVEKLLDFAARAGDMHAQYALACWYATLDEDAQPIPEPGRRNNYRKAIHWLTVACEKGDARAWYAMFKIYTRPNSGLYQYRVEQAERWLERAAELGHARAQLELGESAWRKRRCDESNDVRAVYWLQRAAAQGDAAARALLDRIADQPVPAPWAQEAQRQLTPEIRRMHPFLAARIELAAHFGLARHEALLLDVNAADRGHCLLVDVRDQYAHSRRRLIQVETGAQRLALSRIARQFAAVDAGPGGPEGNYRKRLYLFAKMTAGAGPAQRAPASVAC